VTQTDQPASDSLPLSKAARFAWIILILATLYISYFHNLGAIGFVGPDEPRYAWIARDMVETGDWVTPRLYGKPWFEKPVLYYWGAALSFKLFGVSETAARLPSAFSALLATLAIAWLAWRMYGTETARWLLLFLPTTVGMIGFSHAAAMDMLFAAMLTIAMAFAARLVGLTPLGGASSSTSFISSTSFTSFFFGFFLGLAVLAKGPAAIILSGGAVLLWAIMTKRWRDAFRCLHPVAIASFCLTALPWYILCARRNPDFFRTFIIEHNFKRYLTPEFQHIQPLWFYIPVLLVAFVPWTIALVWSTVSESMKSWRQQHVSLVSTYFLSWIAFCLIFFSASKSKLPGYILPAVPAIGLLLARSYSHLVPRNEKSFLWLHLAFGILSIPAGLLLLWLGAHFHTSPITGQAMVAVGWSLLLISCANLLLAYRRKRPGSSIIFSPFCVLPVLLLVFVFPKISAAWLRYDISGKTLASEIVANRIPTDQISVGRMSRGQQFSLSFYLHREVESWSGEAPNDEYLLLRSKECKYDVKPPWTCDEKPVLLPQSGWFLYLVRKSPSPGGLAALGGNNDLRQRIDR
jgi:4-amino-4-deoxy-L-arabinose transferase-like glycosyltransferase